MPTTQVINYQQDPGQKQILDASKDIADSIYKMQSLKLTSNYYKILAQNAQTDQEKAKFERWAKLQDFKQKIIETTDPNAKAVFLQALKDGPYQGDAQTMMSDMADTQEKNNEVYENLRNAKPEPGSATEGQLRGAQMRSEQGQGEKYRAEAAYYNDPGAFMKKMRAGMVNGNTGATGDDYMPGDFTAPLPGGGSMNFVSPAANQAKAEATAVGSGVGKKTVDMASLKDSLKGYLSTVSGAIRETGGPSSTKLESLFKGGIGKASSYVTADSNMSALEQQRDPLALQLADFINGGRPTEPDKEAALKMLPSPMYPRRTNKLLTDRLNTLFKLPSTGNPDVDGARRTSFVNQALQTVNTDVEFARRARELGKTDAEINRFLDDAHKKQGN